MISLIDVSLNFVAHLKISVVNERFVVYCDHCSCFDIYNYELQLLFITHRGKTSLFTPVAM